jgi:iron complex outermembrane receptor protein
MVLLTQAGGAIAQTADQGAAASPGLEEVVVTARRREEKIQSVPVAITAFSQQDIEQKHIEQMHDLIGHVPSLGMSLPQSDANAPYAIHTVLRGLQGVVTYFADVPSKADYSTSTGLTHGLSPGNFFDLDHVEVDKGPQGTLFGKNSIGGLISLQPKRPTGDFEGYIKATVGNYDDREFEGAINIPVVTDKLLVRIAGASQQRDGYTTDVTNGKDYDNRDYYSWRVGVTLRPSDDFENYFLYTGYWQDSNGSSTILLNANPSFPAISNMPIASVLAQQQALGIRRELGRTTPGIGKDYFYGFVDQATWDIDDDLSLKNIASANVTKTLATEDSDGTYLPIISIGDPVNPHGWTENEVQYTEELRLQGKALAGKLDWVVGGYLEYDHPLGDSIYVTDTLGNLAYYHFHNSARSQAGFVHGIYDLSDWVDGLRFTAGYRYTWDFNSVVQRATTGADGISRSSAGAPTNCSALFADRNCVNAVSGNFNSPGWNLSLDEQLTDKTLIYVRSGNAYRPGGFNLTVAPQFQKYQPEKVTDVEIGLKTEWNLFGIEARTNVDLFHTDYKSIQISRVVSFVDATGATRVANAFQNASSATIEGGEFEGTFVPVNGLEISPHYSYVYPKYDSYPGLDYNVPFIYYTKVEWGVSGTYHLPLDESLGDISLTANYSRNGQQYVSITYADPLNVTPSYGLVDLRVDWQNMMGYSVDAAFFMTNALDAKYIAGSLPLYTQLGFDGVSYSEPRMFGFSLKYRFGGPSEEPQAAPTVYVPPPVAAPAPAPKSYLVFFDFDKSDLTSQAAEVVDTAAKNAGPAKVTRLTVTGHTDTVGSDAYNLRLSRRRAESVAKQLEKDGIPSSEIEIVAKGKRDLLVPTGDGVREPQNRRVQIVYSGGSIS